MSFKFPKKITFYILVPVILFVQIFTRPLASYFSTQNSSMLKIVSHMGMDICDENFNELLLLRLIDDPTMAETMRRDALQRIKDVLEHFSYIDILVIEDDRNIVCSTHPEFVKIGYHTFSAIPVKKKGEIVGTEGFIIDITQRKRMEEKLSASLKEKEILLKEIHHRVKNNLNIVASLLNLQIDQITNVEQSKNALLMSRKRVYSMALVHEKLYESETISSINMKYYIRSLPTLKKIPKTKELLLLYYRRLMKIMLNLLLKITG